ncbi:MAG: hypothetical protein QMD94_02710 [Candidatus Omnitrophota bacterium]|nr:hypothetical protein [Candidatus Omnitrophota bacterium]
MKKQKIGLGILIISLAIFFLLSYIWKAINSSGYFKVKEIVYGIGKYKNTFLTTETSQGRVLNSPTSLANEVSCKNIGDTKRVSLSYLLDEDIFSIDLRKEASLILGSFPQYCQIKLVKVLPHRIFADFIRRKPIAYLSGYRNFALDENGVLFYLSEEPESLELPLILGLENKLYPKPAQRYNFKEAVLVLDIIKAVGINKVIKNFKLKKIKVTSPLSATTVFLNPESSLLPIPFEVRLGGSNIDAKFNILADLITQEKANLGRIEYFDLRFEEPVVKLKDTSQAHNRERKNAKQ